MTELRSLTNPRTLTPFGSDFDHLFNRMMRGWPSNWADFAPSREPQALRAFEHMPKVEVKENGKSYTVTVELPGLDDKDVKVQVHDDLLGDGRIRGPRARTRPRLRPQGHRDEASSPPAH